METNPIKKEVQIDQISVQDLRDELYSQLMLAQVMRTALENTSSFSEVGALLYSQLMGNENVFSVCLAWLDLKFPPETVSETNNDNSEL